MSTIKFDKKSSTENGIITQVHTTIWYNTINDQYGNELATDISKEKKREVSSIIKQMEGSKYSVYLRDGVPIAMEHDTAGEIGGLWFEKKRLIDYDGCGCLPNDIIKLVRKLGFTVPRDFQN